MTAPVPRDADRREPGRLEQIAIDLFYGWGYAFYREENRLRADDLLVRQRAGGLLGAAHRAIDAAEAAYRREKLPPPSRAQPRPDPVAVAGAQAIERLSRDVGALEGQIRAQPVPEPDRMGRWLREEATLLAALRDHDLRLVSRAEGLREMVTGRDGAWLLDNGALVADILAGLAVTLRQRADALAG